MYEELDILKCKDLQKIGQKQVTKMDFEKRKPENSFSKGIREVAERDRREAAEVREEIRAELGNIGRSAYYYRQWGITPHTPAERSSIESVFRRHNVMEPWGL